MLNNYPAYAHDYFRGTSRVSIELGSEIQEKLRYELQREPQGNVVTNSR
jgi:hypothetical protein